MKSDAKLQSVDSDKLRPLLHLKIDRMDGDQLNLFNQVLLQIEAEELADKLGAAFDGDQAEGKIERVSQLVRQFRAEHRY